MSQEHETARPTDSLPDEGQQALSALRNVWGANEQTSADIEESCGNTKSCKSMEEVGFAGLADGAEGDQSKGNELRAGWKTQLEREGKQNTEAKSVRDLVFNPSESKQ
ncbi:MAG: hypothetical protein M3O70_09310 [Actinomycetota bacterium]|nr:hypothetical protein [Actinomycetota bacterium]